MAKTRKMTFSEFRKTGMFTKDIGRHVQDECLKGTPGMIYLDKLHIEQTEEGEWSLDLNSAGWIVNNGELVALEHRLWEWACDEGYCDMPEEAKSETVYVSAEVIASNGGSDGLYVLSPVSTFKEVGEHVSQLNWDLFGSNHEASEIRIVLRKQAPEEVEEKKPPVKTVGDYVRDDLLVQFYHPKEFAFLECEMESNVGEMCQKLLDRTAGLMSAMHDIDELDRRNVYLAAFNQCEIYYRG